MPKRDVTQAIVHARVWLRESAKKREAALFTASLGAGTALFFLMEKTVSPEEVITAAASSIIQ